MKVHALGEMWMRFLLYISWFGLDTFQWSHFPWGFLSPMRVVLVSCSPIKTPDLKGSQYGTLQLFLDCNFSHPWPCCPGMMGDGLLQHLESHSLLIPAQHKCIIITSQWGMGNLRSPLLNSDWTGGGPGALMAKCCEAAVKQRSAGMTTLNTHGSSVVRTVGVSCQHWRGPIQKEREVQPSHACC